MILAPRLATSTLIIASTGSTHLRDDLMARFISLRAIVVLDKFLYYTSTAVIPELINDFCAHLEEEMLLSEKRMIVL